jgi:hypothetical protein
MSGQPVEFTPEGVYTQPFSYTAPSSSSNPRNGTRSILVEPYHPEGQNTRGFPKQTQSLQKYANLHNPNYDPVQSAESGKNLTKLPKSSTAAYWKGVNAAHTAYPLEVNVSSKGIARFDHPLSGVPKRTIVLPQNPKSHGMRSQEAMKTAIASSGMGSGTQHFVVGNTGGLQQYTPAPPTFHHGTFYTKAQQDAMRAERWRQQQEAADATVFEGLETIGDEGQKGGATKRKTKSTRKDKHKSKGKQKSKKNGAKKTQRRRV